MSIDTLDSGRSGFALPATLLAMFVIGAIVTGGFYMSSQEHNVSLSTELGAQALQAAEYGLEESVAGFTTNDMEPLALGAAHLMRTGSVWNGFTGSSTAVGEYAVHVVPLGGRIYLVQSEGAVTRGNRVGRRRVAKLVRSDKLELPYKSAMTVYGKLAVQGNSLITGYDACTTGAVAGVVATSDTLVSGGDTSKERITGEPKVSGDSLLLSTVEEKLDIDGLIAQRTLEATGEKSIAASTVEVNGEQVCNKNDPNNFGAPNDPTHPCHDYFPVIHAPGNLQLNTGNGQGILIVDGDLELAGHVNFFGVVIVRGSFRIRGTGQGTGKISGTVIALGGGAIDTESTTLGDAQVSYDSCSIDRALGSLAVRPFSDRAWIMDIPSVAP